MELGLAGFFLLLKDFFHDVIIADVQSEVQKLFKMLF